MLETGSVIDNDIAETDAILWTLPPANVALKKTVTVTLKFTRPLTVEQQDLYDCLSGKLMDMFRIGQIDRILTEDK